MNRLVPIVGLVLASLVLVKAVRPVIAEALDPQQATVSGVVYEDRNGNDNERRGRARRARRQRHRRRDDGRDRLGRAVPTRGGCGAADHRPGVHHQAGGLRRADRPVQDPAVLPRPGAARGRRRGGRRLRAAPRPERAQRRLHVRQRRRPAPQREHGAADAPDHRDLEGARLRPGLRRPHRQRHRRGVHAVQDRHDGVEAAGLARRGQPRVLQRRPVDLRGADRQLPPPRGAGVVLVRPRQPPLPRAREQRRGADRGAARVDGGRPRGARRAASAWSCSCTCR